MSNLFSTYDLITGFAFAFLSILQCSFLNKNPSDHVGHLYLINEMKKHKWKLPTAPTKILNKSTWGGYPVLLHFLISKFPKSSYSFFSLTMKTIIVIATSLSLILLLSPKTQLISYALFLILFSPYNFDMSNATNYGISSRTLGQFFLIMMVVSISSYPSLDQSIEIKNLFIPILLCMAVIGFNVFATQALLIFSLVSMFFGNFLPSIITVISRLIKKLSKLFIFALNSSLFWFC